MQDIYRNIKQLESFEKWKGAVILQKTKVFRLKKIIKI